MLTLEVGLGFILVSASLLLLLAVAAPAPTSEGSPPYEPRVRRVVADWLCVDAHQLTLTTTLRGDLGLRTADLIELAPALEAEFGIIIPERVLRTVRTYGDMVRATVLLASEPESDESAPGPLDDTETWEPSAA